MRRFAGGYQSVLAEPGEGIRRSLDVDLVQVRLSSKLTRRHFIPVAAAAFAANARPALAITMDDVNWKSIPALYIETACDRILAAMPAKAALFATGSNVDNPQG